MLDEEGARPEPGPLGERRAPLEGGAVFGRDCRALSLGLALTVEELDPADHAVA